MKVWFRAHDESRDAPGRVCEVIRVLYDYDTGVMGFIFAAETGVPHKTFAAIKVSRETAAQIQEKLYTYDKADLREFPAYFDDPLINFP